MGERRVTVRKFAQLPIECALVDIGGDDHREVQRAQGGGHVGSVIRWIGQAGGALIGAIADDERDAFLRLCSERDQHRQDEKTVADRRNSRVHCIPRGQCRERQRG